MATHILLIEDVQNLGRSGDVVRVKPGYARNFLLPQKRAVFADKNAMRLQERLKEERLKVAAEDKKHAVEIAKKFETVVVSTEVKVDRDGHLYGSVSVVDLIHLVKDQAEMELEKHNILIKPPIKKLGVHTIELTLNEGVPATFTLKVTPEGGELEPVVQEVEAEVEEEVVEGE